MITVLVIAPGSTTVQIRQADVDLAFTRELVGGHIEHVTLAHDLGMYMNEEGRIDGLAHNAVASRLYWAARNLQPSEAWDIRGPVVLVGPPDDDGNDTSVPDHVITRLARVPGLTLEDHRA